MAWTPTILGKEFTDGTPYINVEFSDGVSKIVAKFVARDLLTLKQQVTNKIKDLTDAQNFVAGLPDGTFDNVIPPNTPPSQAQIDQSAFIMDYQLLVKIYNSLIVPGIITTANAKYQAILTRVKNALAAHPEYLDAI